MIDEFNKENAFLSNFYPSNVSLNGIIYPTVEHAYQAAKTLNLTEREMIRNQDTPSKAKRFGQQVNLREDWEDIKIFIMEGLIRQKFTNHGTIRNKLIETENEKLVEGNTWGDRFWGIDAITREGENNLGKILMKVRKELKEEVII